MKTTNQLLDELCQIDGNLFQEWHILQNLKKNDAKLVYLPGVTQKQLSLLQKELSEKIKTDSENAKNLIRYILSHHIHVESALGTSEPVEIIDALNSISQRERISILNNLKEITLFINPALL